LALVLGGGGIKGWAHIGVIRVLAKAGVPVDLVVGASAGALMGSLYAASGDTVQLERIAGQASPLSLLRWFAGDLRVSPRSGAFARALHDCLGDLTFADLRIPLALTAIDIADGEVRVIAEGPVASAVEASIRPPVIMSNIRIGERYFVDGGLHNTVPVAVAQALGAERVIAVNVGEFFRLPAVLLPLSAAFGRSLRLKTRAPSGLRGQVAFMAELLARWPAQRPQPDVLIRPNMRGIRSTLPLRMATAVRRGERAAVAALPAIQQLLSAEAQPADSRDGSATMARPGVVTPSRSFSAQTSHSM
jgi:NTE family protein